METSIDDAGARALGAWLSATWRATHVAVTQSHRVPGGVVAVNIALEVTVQGGPMQGEHALVLRHDAAVPMPGCLSRRDEFAVLRAAFDAGIKVPEPLLAGEDAAIAPSAFIVLRCSAGAAAPDAVFADERLLARGDAFADELGVALARLHRLPFGELPLEVPQPTPAEARIDGIAALLETIPSPQPVIEWGIRHLRRYAPPFTNIVLCHRDLRIGNLLVNDGHLGALLNFDSAGLGDPHEDLGGFCARCERHGRWGEEAGGIGSRAALYCGYESVAKQPVDDGRVRYYELLAVVRRAVIALAQGERWRLGRERALDLALAGLRLPELELAILQTIDALRGA